MFNDRSGFLVLLVCAMAAGCATVGREFDTTHAHDVKVGQAKTTITDWFGEPEQKTSHSPNAKGCVEQWLYRHGHSSGGKTSAQALVVEFDGQGSVCDTAYSEVNR